MESMGIPATKVTVNLSFTHRAALVLALFLAACSGGGTGSGSDSTNGGSGQPSADGWQRQPGNPLIVPRVNFATVDHGPADPSVLFDESDNKWKIWFSSTLKDVDSGASTGTVKYAESSDGVHWTDAQVVFQVSSDPGAWDHTAVETPAVIKNPDPAAPADRKFMMWYSGANTDLAASENRPATIIYYSIGLAYSADGKSFTRYAPGLAFKPGLVLAAGPSVFAGGLSRPFGDGLVADPEVIYKDNLFQMWFSSYAETVPSPVSPDGRDPIAFGIAHMTSSDGVNWIATHPNPLASLYKPGDSAGGQQPSVLFNQKTNQYEMWFSNDTAAERGSLPCSYHTVIGFWRAASGDGVNWSPDYSRRSLTYDANLGYEALGFLTGVEVVLVGGNYQAYYSAWGTQQLSGGSVYTCPDQQGNPIPALLTLNRASLAAP